MKSPGAISFKELQQPTRGIAPSSERRSPQDKVQEKIGEGGRGEVCRTTDTKLNREVALKSCPSSLPPIPSDWPGLSGNPNCWFHSITAAIYGFEKADGVHCLAMGLVPGETLAERVAKGPPPVEEALEFCAEALDAIHTEGIVH